MPNFNQKIKEAGPKNLEKGLRAYREPSLRKPPEDIFGKRTPLHSRQTPFNKEPLFVEPRRSSVSFLKELKKALSTAPPSFTARFATSSFMKSVSGAMRKAYEWLFVLTKGVKDRLVAKFKQVKGSFTGKF